MDDRILHTQIDGQIYDTANAERVRRRLTWRQFAEKALSLLAAKKARTSRDAGKDGGRRG